MRQIKREHNYKGRKVSVKYAVFNCPSCGKEVVRELSKYKHGFLRSYCSRECKPVTDNWWQDAYNEMVKELSTRIRASNNFAASHSVRANFRERVNY